MNCQTIKINGFVLRPGSGLMMNLLRMTFITREKLSQPLTIPASQIRIKIEEY